jgi:hypothetical protein
MAKKKKKKKGRADELTPEEVEEQNGEPLPDREAMSIVRMPGVIAPEPIVPLDLPPAE